MAISATANKKDVQFIWEGKDKRGHKVRGKALAANEQARSLDDLLINGALEADVGAAKVADRREPAQEHLLHDPRSVQRDERIRQSRVVGRVGERRHDMGMAVD